MKKILTLALILALVFSMFSCAEDQFDTDYTYYNSELSYVGYATDPEIKELALNKDALDDRSHLPIYKCTSTDELTEFKANNLFCLTGWWDEVGSFEDATKNCNAEFFTKNDLLIIYIETNSCSYRFGVDSIVCNEGLLTVNVKETRNPIGGDEAMGGWLLTVSISKLKGIKDFDAVLIDYKSSLSFPENEFIAETYIQSLFLSSYYSLDIKIRDGEIFINNSLYNEVGYIRNFDVTYSQSLVQALPDNETEANEFLYILNKINHQNGCYLLYKKDDGKVDNIVVYNIDGVYYFLSFFENGEVGKIYKANF